MSSAGSNDTKLHIQKGGNDVNETSFYNSADTDAFLTDKRNGVDDDVESPAVIITAAEAVEEDDDNTGNTKDFNGLTREELERFSSDPKWIKIRWVLFILLVVGWVSMLVAAVIIVVVEPKCPPTPDLEWYQDGVAYNVDVDKFQDTNGDGVGDLAGIKQRLDHFQDLSVKSVWIGNVLDENEPSKPQASVGSLEDFKDLAKTFKDGGIRIVMTLDLSAYTGDILDELVRSWVQAGAGGFVLSSSGGSDEEFTGTVSRLQVTILDEEFNKKDDRARIVIGGDDVPGNASAGLEALVYQPVVTCDDMSSFECTTSKLMALGSANVNATLSELEDANKPSGWRVIKSGIDLQNPICNLALQLTIPGTPNVMYGDEVGMTSMPRGYMVWDDSETGGFTGNESWTRPNPVGDLQSVLAQRSAGFEEESVYSLFRDLAAVRKEESSMKWGEFQLLDFGEGVIAFVRNATRLPPVVVAINPTDGRAGSLIFEEYSVGEVLVSNGVDLAVGDTVELDAVYMPKGSVLVARMSLPPKK